MRKSAIFNISSLVLGVVLCIVLHSGNARAAQCTTVTCTGTESTDPSLTVQSGVCSASGTSSVCYMDGAVRRKVSNCASCIIGTRTLLTHTGTSGCTIQYYGCVKQGGGTVTVMCPSECSSETNWSNRISNGRQGKCVRYSNTNVTCQYRCADGYYASQTEEIWDSDMETVLKSAITCVQCPDGGDCAAGWDAPVCRASHYLSARHISVGTPTSTYSCPQCPGYRDCGDANCSTPTSKFGNSKTGAESITECYIQNGKWVQDDTGIFQIEAQGKDPGCYYEGTTIVGPPIDTGGVEIIP